MSDDELAVDARGIDGVPQVAEIGPRQWRRLDSGQGFVIDHRQQVLISLAIGVRRATSQTQGVGLDAIVQRGGDGLGGDDREEPQIVRHDRRRRADPGLDVVIRDLRGRFHEGMVVDAGHDRDFLLVEILRIETETRLGVDEDGGREGELFDVAEVHQVRSELTDHLPVLRATYDPAIAKGYVLAEPRLEKLRHRESRSQAVGVGVHVAENEDLVVAVKSLGQPGHVGGPYVVLNGGLVGQSLSAPPESRSLIHRSDQAEPKDLRPSRTAPRSVVGMSLSILGIRGDK